MLGQFAGRYFVLVWRLSLLSDICPDDIGLDRLVQGLEEGTHTHGVPVGSELEMTDGRQAVAFFAPVVHAIRLPLLSHSAPSTIMQKNSRQSLESIALIPT
jgi:hypothetical protein